MTKTSSVKKESTTPKSAPAAAASTEAAYIPKAIELTKKTGSKTIGKPKSGKSWNVGSKRSAKHTRYNPKTWEQKMQDRKQMRALKDRLSEAKDKRVSEVSLTK